MEEDVEKYTKESTRSFNRVKIKNKRERAIHNHRAVGLDNEAKQAWSKMEKAQRDMVAHLQQLKTDQLVCGMTDLKEPTSDSGSLTESEDEDKFVNPFPINFKGAKTAETDFEKMGKKYAARRGRRMSREFEDLDVHTATGKLLPPDLRTRNSFKFLLPPIVGLDGQLRSRTGSSTNLTASLRQLTTLGEPEYIKSVRRPRKSIDQQQDQLDTLRAFSQLQNSHSRVRAQSFSSRNPFERGETIQSLSPRTRIPSAGNAGRSPRNRPDSALSTRSSIDSPMLMRRKSPMISIDLGNNTMKRQDSLDGAKWPPTSPLISSHVASPMISRKQFRQRKLSASSNKSDTSPRGSDISPRNQLTSPPPAKNVTSPPSPPAESNGVVIKVISCETDSNQSKALNTQKVSAGER